MSIKKFKYTGLGGDARFTKRIQELLDQAKRLAEKQAAGFVYKRIWVKPTTVKRHERSGYFAYMPRKRKTKQVTKRGRAR